MRFLILEHVPAEGPGRIADFIQAHAGEMKRHRMYEAHPLPEADSFDALVIMGGPMGVSDHAEYHWLSPETIFIQQAIDAGKHVLGVCLGAQLIAHALGAEVRANPVAEIGWYPIQLADEFLCTPIGQGLPAEFPVLHWHGDTFNIPEMALPMAASEGCRNQGFLFDARVLALQFHLEMGPAEVETMVRVFTHQLEEDHFVQSPTILRTETLAYQARTRDILESLLFNWLQNG